MYVKAEEYIPPCRVRFANTPECSGGAAPAASVLVCHPKFLFLLPWRTARAIIFFDSPRPCALMASDLLANDGVARDLTSFECELLDNSSSDTD